MLARARPNGEAMATSSIWRYILLLKLNSAEKVAYSISSTNTSCGIGDVIIVVESSQSVLEQIFMVSVNGTFFVGDLKRTEVYIIIVQL